MFRSFIREQTVGICASKNSFPPRATAAEARIDGRMLVNAPSDVVRSRM